MKPSELLKAAYAILSEGPHRWTKGVFARTEDNHVIQHCDKMATCFCGLGALYKAAGRNLGDRTIDGHTKAERMLDNVAYGCWVSFNDAPNTTYEQMLAKYREAIELAEQAELDDSPEV